MSKFTITEEERRRILNLHETRSKNHYLKEDTGCPCPDGTTQEMCCSKSEKGVEAAVNKNDMTVGDKRTVEIEPANAYIELENTVKNAQSQLDMINRQKDEQLKKEQITTLQKRFDDAYNRVVSPEFNKLSKAQRKELLNDKHMLQSQLDKLQGLEIEVKNEKSEKTADEKVSAWVAVAASILSLFTTVSDKLKNPNQQ
jgi:hypothetical protein